jgi:hypothetical protein
VLSGNLKKCSFQSAISFELHLKQKCLKLRQFTENCSKKWGKNMSLLMGLDLLPILPCALPSGTAVATVGQSARLQQHCQNSRFFLLLLGL